VGDQVVLLGSPQHLDAARRHLRGKA
jgi:hypothetical protein